MYGAPRTKWITSVQFFAARYKVPLGCGAEPLMPLFQGIVRSRIGHSLEGFAVRKKSITPEELAKRFNQPVKPKPVDDGWVRESMTVGRHEVEAKLEAWLMKYPPAAYWSKVEWWQELPGDRVELRMKRLKSAD